MYSRRKFLKQISGVALAVGSARYMSPRAFADVQGNLPAETIELPGEEGMIVLIRALPGS
jgi:hypothetical protein